MSVEDSESARDARRLARAVWAGALSHDGSQPDVDASILSPAERVLAVWTATRAAWAFTGRPLVRLPRGAGPGKVVRPS